MSKIRKSFHYLNHDRLLRDPFMQTLSDEALGLLFRLHCMVGATSRGHQTGSLYGEDGKVITAGDLLSILSMGDEARKEKINKHLELLVRARQISCTDAFLENNRLLKISFWKHDQKEGGQK